MRFLPASIATLLAALALPAALCAEELVPITDEATLIKTLAGKTFYGAYADMTKWVEYYRPDGTSIYQEDGHACLGHWSIKNGQVCFSYPGAEEEDNCVVLRRSLKREYFLFDTGDEPPIATKVVAGDPEGLASKPLGACR